MLWPACVFLLNVTAKWGSAIPSRELFSFPRPRHGTQLHRQCLRFLLQWVPLLAPFPYKYFPASLQVAWEEKGWQGGHSKPTNHNLKFLPPPPFFRDWHTCTVKEKDAENLHCAGKCSQNKSHNHTELSNPDFGLLRFMRTKPAF